MSKWSMGLWCAGVAVIGILGCADSDPAPEAVSQGAVDPAFVVSSEPQGSVSVGDARASVQDDEEVVLIGKIGGSAEPFVDGIAAFTIVDPKVPHCAADEGCPTPWDYCCTQNQVKENIATVKVVNAEGQPVAKDARELLGVKELNTVVVHGKAERDDQGNLALLADQVYVRD